MRVRMLWRCCVVGLLTRGRFPWLVACEYEGGYLVLKHPYAADTVLLHFPWNAPCGKDLPSLRAIIHFHRRDVVLLCGWTVATPQPTAVTSLLLFLLFLLLSRGLACHPNTHKYAATNTLSHPRASPSVTYEVVAPIYLAGVVFSCDASEFNLCFVVGI